MNKRKQQIVFLLTIVFAILGIYATILIFKADTCDKPIQYMTGRQLLECNNK